MPINDKITIYELFILKVAQVHLSSNQHRGITFSKCSFTDENNGKEKKIGEKKTQLAHAQRHN